MTFQRARGKHSTQKSDNVGTVAILVRLITPAGTHVKGNVMRQCSIKNATVSEVFAAIEKALFNQ